jgi:hypothetical protein
LAVLNLPDVDTGHDASIQLFNFIPQIRFGNEQARAGILRNHANFSLPQQRRRRKRHRTDANQCQERNGEVWTIQESNDDAIAGIHSAFPERTGHPVDFVPEFAICEDFASRKNRGRRAAARFNIPVQKLVAGIKRVQIRKLR